MEIVDVGNIYFQIKVELAWVQDPCFPLKSSCIFPTNLLKISYRTKVSQNKISTHVDF